MRLISSCIILFATAVSIAQASDNTKLVEATLKNYNESVGKADDVRSKAVEKARHETVQQLARMASKAYSEKDRVAETNAWKAVLTVDRSHTKAVQYFKDLGTLEKTLAELPKDVGAPVAQPTSIVGKWSVYRDNSGIKPFSEYDFRADGTIHQDRGQWGTYSVEGDALIGRTPDGGISRFTVIGDKMIQEQWANGYPKEPPT